MNDYHMPDGRRLVDNDELVSYLDGELDAEQTSRVEEALAADPNVRQQLRQLERSWQLLDELPRTHVDESFTRSTVEMIAVKAQEDLQSIQAELPGHNRRVAVGIGVALLVAAVGGFALISVFARRADDKLLQDLPVIEKLDQYREAEDIEFLRLLKAKGFSEQEAKNER